jgi:sugar transferase (PEP-CTERM system associated)
VVLGDLLGDGIVNNVLLYPKLITLVVATQVCLYYSDLYRDSAPTQWTELLARIIVALLTGGVFLSAVYYIVPALKLHRLVLIPAFPFACIGLTLWRSVFHWVLGQEAWTQNLLILGTGKMAIAIARVALNSKRPRYRVLGFLGEDSALVGQSLLNPSVLGTLDSLEPLSQSLRIDSVVVALEDRRGRLPVDTLMSCRAEGIQVEEAEAFYERYTGQVPVRSLRPSSFVFSLALNQPRMFRACKHALDFLLALIGLAFALPVIVVAGILLWFESGWPVLYGQERVGRKGKAFVLHKLRTMRLNAEQDSGPVWASSAQDPRITRVGGFLRKTRLDELPQLVNVLKGEMSFVGPRPERPVFVEQLREAIPYYDARHAVRPGVTGWAQTRYRYSSSVEESEKKLQYDLYYVKNMSVYLDMLILIDTAKVVLSGKGAR